MKKQRPVGQGDAMQINSDLSMIGGGSNYCHGAGGCKRELGGVWFAHTARNARLSKIYDPLYLCDNLFVLDTFRTGVIQLQ